MDRLKDRAREWRLDVERIAETPTSLVAFGTRDGRRAVVKVIRSPGEEWNAGAVVAAFGGRGVVRVLEHGPGAMLLEELTPGTPLVELVREGRDDEATRILAGVIREMQAAPPATGGFPTAEAWGEGFDRSLASGDEQLPPGLVADARERYHELCPSQGTRRLLHGDLHHHNVLLDHARGWLAIDPKGVVAELEYELGAALRNPGGSPELYSSASAVRRRVEGFADELAVDPERVLAWAYVQAVLSAVWIVEDEGAIDADAPALRVVEALAPLRP